MDKRVPKKVILKNAPGRHETEDASALSKSPLKWDEDNLLVNESEKPATRMKIDEPKTPYHHAVHASDESDELEPDLSGAVQSLEAIEKRKQWEAKRKQHYHIDGGGALLKHERPSQQVRKGAPVSNDVDDDDEDDGDDDNKRKNITKSNDNDNNHNE